MKLMGSHVGNHLFHLRALCNGFIAGVIGVSMGSGAMKPMLAVVSGAISGVCYLAGCYAFRHFQIDDPLENCQIYIIPGVWAAVNSVIFIETDGALVRKEDTGKMNRLGTQLLGMTLISVLTLVVSWAYFFPMQRFKKLRVPKSTEVLGRDTVMNAISKGIELDEIIEKIESLYPEPKKRGC